VRAVVPRGQSISALAGGESFAYFAVGTSNDLWRTDGTVEGTVALGRRGSSGINFATIGDRLIFRAAGSETLWTSDGTAAGTAQFAAVTAYGFIGLGDRVLFVTGPFEEQVVWTTNGTAGGTLPLARLGRGLLAGAVAAGARTFLASVSFAQSTGLGYALWASDGTAARTAIVHQFDHRPEELAMALSGNHLFFAAVAADVGDELWALRLDGQTACAFDCNGDGRREDAEISGAVEIMLGAVPLAGCIAGDRDDDLRITVDEVVHAVAEGTGGCG
jgi:hypothetical protein